MEGETPAPPEPAKKSRCLLFDRRYGWIVDEWRDPAEEALAGGRGMFCLLPMAKSLIELSSSMVNQGLDSANRLLSRSSETSSSTPDADISNWLSNIESKGCTAEFQLATSKIDIATQEY